jgi:hypothetical protein
MVDCFGYLIEKKRTNQNHQKVIKGAVLLILHGSIWLLPQHRKLNQLNQQKYQQLNQLNQQKYQQLNQLNQQKYQQHQQQAQGQQDQEQIREPQMQVPE